MTSPPSYVVEEEKRSAASSRERGPRLPHTGSASAYPMRQEYYSILCRNWQDVRRAFPQGKAKRKSPMWGIDKRWKAGIMKIRGGAADRREPPHDITVVTVKRVRLGRLLLFYLENQRNDADDQNAELKQVGISHHDTTPLRCSGGGKEKCGLLPKEGPPAYRVLAAPAHIRCAEAIIARYVEFGKQGKNFKDNT